MAFIVASCSDSTGPAVPDALELGVSTSIVMTAGASDTVTVVVRDASGHELNSMPIVWTSSNEAIVRVDSAGVLTADSSGIATITAWLDTLHASFDVTVVQTIQSLVVEPADTVIEMFQSIPLRVVALDGAGRNVTVNMSHLSFNTSDSSVLVVDSAGIVRGSGWGRGVISVHADTVSAAITLHSAPREVDLGGVQLVNFDLGLNHACGQDVSGDLYCWGQNSTGQLGIADTTITLADQPTLVPGGSAYTRYSAGQHSTCGLNAAGEIWCWGGNGYGELGLGFRGFLRRSFVPVKVSGNHVWRSVSAGEHATTCGTTDANIAYCWGNNETYQAGREPAVDYDTLVAPVSGSDEMMAVDVDFFAACGLSPAGQPLCWGDEALAHFSRHALPRAVVSPALVSISVGNHNNDCGLTSAGEAWCWGLNFDRDTAAYPDGKINLDAVPFAQSLRFTQLSMGPFFRDGCGITTEGDLHCWGQDYVWPGPPDAPPPHMGEPGVKFLDTDLLSDRCALTTEHRMYCW
jgi:hypothetical protein